jgi:hypothetical protein
MIRDSGPLGRLAAASRAPHQISAADLDSLHVLAIAALKNDGLRRRVLGALLQSLVDVPETHQLFARALALCWKLGSSNSGTAVRVCEPAPPAAADDPASGGRVGVLILGFAGSNFGMLKPLEREYQELFPAWRVVTTIGCLLTEDAPAAESAQLAEVEHSIA